VKHASLTPYPTLSSSPAVDDFRANWKYNFGDEKFQAFLREIPLYVQW
jgi:phosphodiesterase/alkaline phosphatase D-like protein